MARTCGTAVAVIVASAILLAPATARADGDPASDVLVAQRAFIPWDARATPTEAARLEAVIAAADRRGYPVRVALIASAADLGSVTQLWRRPQTYAEFVGVELSLAVRGTIVVVMPDGAGVYRSSLAGAAAQAALAHGVRVARGGSLAAVAVAAVESLAAAAGHPLPRQGITPPRHGAGRAPASNPAAWVVFIAGLLAIALAWAASLRARPPRWRGHKPSTSAGE